MKVLIGTLNSKFIHSSLAVAYLTKAVDSKLKGNQNFEMVSQEFTINNSEDYIYGEIIAGKYDVICFSCYIWNTEKTLHICENVKKARPETVVVLGGPEVSFDSEELLKEHGFIDYILCGEGEETLPNLLEQLMCESRESLPKIIAGEPVLPEDILFPYDEEDKIDENKIIYYESARGCPYNCSYCMSSIDKRLRAFPMERVKNELKFFIDKKPKQVKFLDRTFNWSKERSGEIWEFLIENDNGVTNFHFELCGEILTDKLIEIISKARKGLFQFEIGIQSTNRKTLAAVDRSTETKRLLSNIKKLIGLRNCHIHVDLIAGLPFENIESFKDSFNDVYALRADALQLGFLKLLKGTKIRNEGNTFGYVFDNKAPYQIIKNDFISPEDIGKLKNIEHLLDDYHNKGGFEKSLKALEKEFETAFDFYEAFAEFYFEKGYHRYNHKKEDNYRILARFALEKTKKGEAVKEIIYQDLLKRMNPEAVKRFNKKGWELSELHI